MAQNNPPAGGAPRVRPPSAHPAGAAPAAPASPPKKATKPDATPPEKPAVARPAARIAALPPPAGGEEPTHGELARRTAESLRSVRQQARVHYNELTISNAEEADELLVGLPLPSFCWELLLQTNILPLGRVIVILGKEGSCKSALLFEMARWIHLASGASDLLENESKFAGGLAMSLLGYNRPDALGHIPTNSTEDWQEKMLRFLKTARRLMDGYVDSRKKKVKGTGRTWPYGIFLDSLSGKTSEDVMKKIDEEGHGEKSFPVDASKNAPFMKAMPGMLVNYPLLVVFSNHLRERIGMTGPGGQPLTSRPGSGQLHYQQSLEFQMQKLGSPRPKAGIEALEVEIRCTKNNFGPNGRRMKAELWWGYEEGPDGNPRQVSRWMWHHATTMMLTSRTTGKKELAAVVDINLATNNTFWSRRLGIPKTKPVSSSAFGKALMDDAEVLRDLRRLFGIRMRKVFVPGKDFCEQMGVLAKPKARVRS